MSVRSEATQRCGVLTDTLCGHGGSRCGLRSLGEAAQEAGLEEHEHGAAEDHEVPHASKTDMPDASFSPPMCVPWREP